MSNILPSWLLSYVPKVAACGTVGYDDIEEIFWVKENHRTSLAFYDSMTDVVKDFGMDCCNLSIDESMKARYRIVNNCLVNSTASEIFFIKNDTLQMNSLEQDFKKWQGFYKRVEENDDWRSAYHLIETLPVLWKPISEPPTFLWNRNDGHSYIDATVIDDSVILDLYLPEYDFSLYVSEDTFENAYLSMGKSIVDTFSSVDCSLKIPSSVL